MMSTVGVEHAKFVNPDLTWKTGTKGNRSVTRRTRKQVTGSTSGVMEASNTCARGAENTAVSESEKVGVAVLGRRFTDKVEQLPIKKRRFVFRSPSPPPLQTSAHIEIPEDFVLPIQQASARPCRNSNFRRKPSRTDMLTTEKLDCIGDFSGIEMLATVACDSGVVDDIDSAEGHDLAEESTEREPNLSACSIPMEENNASLETASLFTKDIVCEGHVENSAFQDNSAALSHKPSAGQDDRKFEKSGSPRDDRANWDLNLSMDAWERASAIGQDDCQMFVRDSSANRSRALQVLQDCEVQKEAHGDNHVTFEKTASSDVPRNISSLPELKDLPSQPNGFDREDHKFEGCADVSMNLDECVPTPVGNSEEPSISPITDADGSTQVVRMDRCLDSSSCPNVGSNELYGENKSSSNSANVNEKTEEGKLLCVENVQVEESDVASPFVPVLEKVTWEIDRPTLNVDDGLNVEKRCDEEMMNTHISDGVESISEIEDLGPSPKCEDAITCADEHGLVNVDTSGQADISLSVPHVETNPAGHDVFEKLMQEDSGNSPATQGVAGCVSQEVCKIDHNDHTGGLGKMGTEDCTADSSDSVSKNDKNWIVGLQNSMELQAGYDSQFEDGELRESYPFWEENEGDEIEHVDYEYDSDEERLCHVAESNEKKVEVEKGFVLGSFDRVVGSDVQDFSSKMIGSEASSKRELHSCTGGKLASDGIQRGRSDVFTDLDPRDEKDAGSGKFIGRDRSTLHLLGRSPVGPHSVSSATNRNSIHCHLRSYNSSYSSGRSRTKSVIDSRDGELREKSPSWEENDFEGEEIEQVNFESDEEKLCPTAEISETKMGIEKKGHSSDSEDVVKKNASVLGDALRGCSTTMGTGSMELTDASKIKKNAVVCRDGSDVKCFSSRLAELKTSKREMRPRVDESFSSDGIQRSRSDVFGDSCPRDGRDGGSDKFMGRDRPALHVRGRSPGGGHFVSPPMGYWDSRRRHSPIYSSSYDAGRPRPRSVIESHVGSDTTVSGSARVSGDNVRRQFLTSSSNGVYRGLGRRKSPANTDDSIGMHTGILHERDTSPGRSRGRRYPQGVSRGFRDRTMPEESTEYSGRMPYRLGRRERSISPFNGGRLNYGQPYKKARSNSRAHSPVAWRRTKSPNSKLDPRMERVRLPFQKRFAADCEEDLMSPRNRFPPHRYSRWFDDRNLETFRGRKSPIRIFRQSQRFESARSVRRPNSDDCFRPLIRSKRFPDMGGGSRAYKYEGSDDDKNGNRYEMIHPVRRFDTDGVVRRFRYNGENSIVGMTPEFDDCKRGAAGSPRVALRMTGEEMLFKIHL